MKAYLDMECLLLTQNLTSVSLALAKVLIPHRVKVIGGGMKLVSKRGSYRENNTDKNKIKRNMKHHIIHG
jgi:hypothetical protein